MEIITYAELASYLGDPTLETNTRLILITDLTNGLVNEKWITPVDPIPFSVKLIALTVASRAWRNDASKAALQSVTRSVDDASRTERYAVSASDASEAGVFLTASELAQLRPTRKRVRSIRLRVPGF